MGDWQRDLLVIWQSSVPRLVSFLDPKYIEQSRGVLHIRGRGGSNFPRDLFSINEEGLLGRGLIE